MTTDTTLKEQNKALTPEDETLKGGKPSFGLKEPSPGTPRTYNQDEVDRLVQLARMEAGREQKAIEVERDHFKTQSQITESKLADTQEELASLEKRIEELSSNDPELNNLEKRAKQLREQERGLKTGLHTLEAAQQIHSQQLTEAQGLDQLITIWQVAEEYGNPDDLVDKLADLCGTLEAVTEEKIRAVAQSLWGKKPAIPSVKPYSGVTSGGRGFSRDKANPDATLKQGFKELKKK